MDNLKASEHILSIVSAYLWLVAPAERQRSYWLVV